MKYPIPKYETLPEYFYHWVRVKPNEPFLKQPYGGDWKVITYKEAYDEAASVASALQNKGFAKGSHIAIFSKNCYHWILADLAIMMGGHISVPLYHSLSGRQLSEVLKASDAKLLFAGKLDAWKDHPDQVEGIPIIRFPHYQGNAQVRQGEEWDKLAGNHELLEKGHVPEPYDLWTILFTSGTTGTPKGVMHVHKSPAQIVKDDLETELIGVGRLKEPNFFSYLPLNHVGEKIGIHTNAIVLGGTISFGENIETFIKNLQDTQPALFFSVPRIWTKFYQGVVGKLPLKIQRILFKIPGLSGVLKKKIRKGLGLGNATIVGTGSAITPVYLKKWYKQLGIHLIEAYGMTEVCGSIAYGADENTPFDSVGKVLKGCEVRIDPQNNEILMKTPYMMKGYYKEPDLTSKVLVNDWLRSGDQGEIDKEGNIRITGRISDAFKTTKGKYITPGKIEELLGSHSKIEQVCVAGLGNPQPIAILNLTEEAKLEAHSKLEVELTEKLDRVNGSLANYEHISTLIVDQMTWNTENAFVTPTLKIRRKAINERYAARYAEWHHDERRVIWI